MSIQKNSLLRQKGCVFATKGVSFKLNTMYNWGIKCIEQLCSGDTLAGIGKNMQRKQVAIIIETMNAYGQGIIRGIWRSLQEHSPCTIFYEERTLDTPPPVWLKNWEGDGIIVRDRSGKSCRLAMKTNAKVVDLSEKRHPGVPTVLTDHALCSELAAEHLKSCRLNEFAFVGIKNRPFSDKRRDAFIKAVECCHVFELRDNEQALSSWGADDSRFIRWLKKLPKPIGIMACYDLAGVRVLQSCNMIGINVPESVAVIGVNNDELQCSMTNPPMSSVIQNQERVGYEACQLLHRLMNGQEEPSASLVIPPLGVASRRSTDILVIPDQYVVHALNLIHEHACEGITINNIARKLNVSRRTLERKFYAHLEKTLHDELVNTQMKRASELLVFSRLTLANVAKQVGFNSVSHFSAVFAKQYGVCPNEYRKMRTSS